MRTIVFALIFLVSPAGLCQTPVKEGDALQSLLAEVHRLRQDIETMGVASQRVQIALHALQMQDAAVVRATQRLENAQNRCSGTELKRQRTAADIQRLESSLSSGTSESDAKSIRMGLTEMKYSLETQTAEAQTCQTAEAEALSQLRKEQGKLIDAQDRIERLDKSLEKLTGAGN